MSVNNDQSFGDQERPDGLCRAAQILGICSIILPIGLISLIISIIALVKVDNSALPKSKRLASIGLVTSLIGIVTGWIVLMGGAVMFPVFSQARNKGKEVACLSHAKQIGLALRMYADDNDDKFPLKENWQSALKVYVTNNEVFTCPSAKVPENSYAMRGERSGASVAKLPDPSNTIFAFDSELPKSHAYGGFEAVSYRHDDRANFIFSDGHAKPVNRSQAQPAIPAPAKQ